MPTVAGFDGIHSHNRFDESRMLQYTDTRVFSDKGLFVLPFNTFFILASFQLYFEVLEVSNESLNMWTNPETGFYGYAHARQNKQTVGNPIPLNQRGFMFYAWNPPEQYQQFEFFGSLYNLRTALNLFSIGNQLYFPSPIVTDFSFGMKLKGKYRVVLRHQYWNPIDLETNGIDLPRQDLIDPEQVKAIDPSENQDVTDDGSPIDAPYDGESDYGEHTPGETEPPDGGGEGGFATLKWQTNWISEQTGQPDERFNVVGGPPQIRNPLERITGPSFNDALRQVSFGILDADGSRQVVVFNGSTNAEEWAQQKSNFTWSVIQNP